MLHTNLRVYYETNFALMHYHKWNVDQIDECMPWEKEVYINMLVQHLKEEQRRYEESQRRR